MNKVKDIHLTAFAKILKYEVRDYYDELKRQRKKEKSFLDFFFSFRISISAEKYILVYKVEEIKERKYNSNSYPGCKKL